jgi:hypothetical protein
MVMASGYCHYMMVARFLRLRSVGHLGMRAAAAERDDGNADLRPG